MKNNGRGSIRNKTSELGAKGRERKSISEDRKNRNIIWREVITIKVANEEMHTFRGGKWKLKRCNGKRRSV